MLGSTQESRRGMGASRCGGGGVHCPPLWPPVSAASPVLLRAQQPCPPEALDQGELQRGLQTPAEFTWELGGWGWGWGGAIVQ